MSHRDRKQHTPQATTPTGIPKKAETAAPTTTTPPAPAPQAEQTQPPAQADQKANLANVSAELRKVLDTVQKDSPAWQIINDQLVKLETEEKASENAKKRLAFDTELRAGLMVLLAGEDGLVKKHGVDLSNRKIIISFPNGSTPAEPFAYANEDINKKPKRNGGGGGFKGGWLPDGKKAKLIDGSSVTEEDSPSALAKKLGLQVTGHRDMPAVFTKPISAETKQEITGVKYEVDAVRGDHFIVKKIA